MTAGADDVCRCKRSKLRGGYQVFRKELNPLVPKDFFSKKKFLGPPALSAVKKFLVQIFDRFWSHLKDFEHRFQIFKKSKKIGKKSVVKKVGSSS